MGNTAHSFAVGLACYTGIIVCCVGCLSGYHGKLACDGVTTNEEIRGKVAESDVYDEGCMKNCRAFWYGGTSRVYIEGTYDTEALTLVEPNVFVIKPPQGR